MKSTKIVNFWHINMMKKCQSKLLEFDSRKRKSRQLKIDRGRIDIN